MLERLIYYTEKRGIQVEMGLVSNVSWIGLNHPLKISLNGCQNEDYILFDLLHELAHIKIRKNWQKYVSRYPAVGLACECYLLEGATKYLRRKQYAVEVIEEEFEAWRVGLNIAKKYDIIVDRHIYQKYASNRVAEYIKKYNK